MSLSCHFMKENIQWPIIASMQFCHANQTLQILFWCGWFHLQFQAKPNIHVWQIVCKRSTPFNSHISHHSDDIANCFQLISTRLTLEKRVSCSSELTRMGTKYNQMYPLWSPQPIRTPPETSCAVTLRTSFFCCRPPSLEVFSQNIVYFNSSKP